MKELKVFRSKRNRTTLAFMAGHTPSAEKQEALEQITARLENVVTTLAFMAGPELQASPDLTSATDEADAAQQRVRKMRDQKIEQAATMRTLVGIIVEEQA